jgi:hypothetical protein
MFRFIKKWYLIIPAVFCAWISYIGAIYGIYGLNRSLGEDSSKTTAFIGAWLAFWVAKYTYQKTKEIMDTNLSKIRANKTGKMQPHLFDEGYEFPDLMTIEKK